VKDLNNWKEEIEKRKEDKENQERTRIDITTLNKKVIG